jgi:uncharacterized protein with HEPN domain
MTKAEFLADARTRDASCMNLIVIGETTTRIIRDWPDFVSKNEEVGWHTMTGMRNRIAHGYHDIDFEIVWDTLTAGMPQLVVRLDAVRAE